MLISMRIKAVYIQMPENEYLRLKLYAMLHRQTMQMVVRSALADYTNANKIRNIAPDDGAKNDNPND